MSLAASVSEASVLGQTLAAGCIIGSVVTALGPLPTILKIRNLKSIEEYPAAPYFTWCISSSLWLSYHLLNENIQLVVALVASFALGLFYVFNYVRYSNKEKRRTIVFLSVSSLLALSGVVYAYIMEMKLAIVIAATVMFFIFLISPMTVIARVVQTKCCASLPFELPCAAALNGVSYVLYGYLVVDDLSLWGTGLVTFLIAAAQLLCHFVYGEFVESSKNLCCFPCLFITRRTKSEDVEDLKPDFDGKPIDTTVITV